MEQIKCMVCGGTMRAEERRRAEWGRRRYRYSCPKCGAHTSRELSLRKAYEAALRRREPEECLTREVIICPYHRRHSYKDRSLSCESCMRGGMTTTTTFSDKKLMIAHMQMYCRTDPDACPVARECTRKYE